MKITIEKATADDLNTVQNLGRFYVYEMSRYCGFLKGWETPSNGLFECHDFSRYWKEPNHYPFLICVDDELAGFVLVNKIGTTQDVDWNIGEFFIVSKYQGKGVGRFVAEEIFTKFPGIWEVQQIPENKGAVTFWEKVVKSYTKGQFTKTEKVIPAPKPYPMIVLHFNTASHLIVSQPHSLNSNNLEEYANPLEYDLEYGQYTFDEDAFYRELAQSANGPLLDIACGTGRVTIPLAQKGFKISGLDISADMLRRAQEKASALDLSIPWVEKDCRTFQLSQKFALIFMAGNAFQAMLTNEDQNRLLTCVKKHLLPGGLFVFVTRNPSLVELAVDSVEEKWHTYTNSANSVTQVSGYHSYDLLSQIATYTTIRKSEEKSASITDTTHIQLRYTYPQELERLLSSTGFMLVNRYGSYCKQSFDGTQEQMICLCQVS